MAGPEEFANVKNSSHYVFEMPVKAIELIGEMLYEALDEDPKNDVARYTMELLRFQTNNTLIHRKPKKVLTEEEIQDYSDGIMNHPMLPFLEDYDESEILVP